MDVMLHVGAHRCATGYFQAFVRHHAATLAADGMAFWGPEVTRDGLLHGALPGPAPVTGRNLARPARGRVQMRLEQVRRSGADDLLICGPRMMGRRHEILRARSLYPSVGDRMARYGAAFDGQVRDVMVILRSPDRFWGSLLASMVANGHPLPDADLLAELADTPRSWRDVLSDLACALPEARIWVMPYETYGDRPEVQLQQLTGKRLARLRKVDRINCADPLPMLRHKLGPEQAHQLPRGEGRWSPFSEAQSAALRERYADDLMWLHAGADGLARLVADPDKKAAGLNPSSSDLTRGTSDDDQNRRLAGPG